MAKTNKDTRPAARLPKGLVDTGAAEARAQRRMLETIRRVYESYGFEPLETPAIEYTEALGKFLPDEDRPNAGVFSFQDEDEQWLSLRYDLTAPLARYVAENFDRLPKPFRRYQFGPVWRNEKPGPGRFRQFLQFDADTVGTDNIAADAEICMLAADTLEALGIRRGDYVIKVNSRKILDSLLDAIGLSATGSAAMRLAAMRAIDKYDRLGIDGVRSLLGQGREDESGAYTRGAGLQPNQIEHIAGLFDWRRRLERPQDFGVVYSHPELFPEEVKIGSFVLLKTLNAWLGQEAGWHPALQDLVQFTRLIRAAGYDDGRIVVDPSVVRGLEYYTGPVLEAEITKEVKNEGGQTVRFGSVGGGGRYDDLVARFTGQKVPATGFSIGVSRLQAALAALSKDKPAAADGPVVVLVMEKDRLADYQKMAQSLRQAGIRAEMYLGTAGMKAQMKYADRRGAPCVVIQGGDERAKSEVQIKDLIEGAKAAATIKDSKEWREGRPAQVSVPEARMVEAVREVLARHKG
jgi:histidyl-tRNA synthetase